MDLLKTPYLPRLAANLCLNFSPLLTVGNTTIVSRWKDVQEVLSRDVDFLIEPVNKERIERVNGPFILGMDRGAQHLTERDALYQALRLVDLDNINTLAQSQANQILDNIPKDSNIDVVCDYARPIAAQSASLLTGIKGPNALEEMQVARALFHELFLNIKGDDQVQNKALAASEKLKHWCHNELTLRRNNIGSPTTEPHSPSTSSVHYGNDMIGRLMAAKVLDDDGIRRTVSGIWVGAIDTTATCVAQILSVILKRPKWLNAIKHDLDEPIKMRHWCWEALRFWPHNPIIVRSASHNTELAGRSIKAGSTVVCFTLAAMHDPSVFVKPKSLDLHRPERHYLHFGGGLHPCAGRAINGIQIPLLVTELLRRQPAIKSNIRFDGPFPNNFTVTLQ